MCVPAGLPDPLAENNEQPALHLLLPLLTLVWGVLAAFFVRPAIGFGVTSLSVLGTHPPIVPTRCALKRRCGP